jgi:hypothetical protein
MVGLLHIKMDYSSKYGEGYDDIQKFLAENSLYFFTVHKDG